MGTYNEISNIVHLLNYELQFGWDLMQRQNEQLLCSFGKLKILSGTM